MCSVVSHSKEIKTQMKKKGKLFHLKNFFFTKSNVFSKSSLVMMKNKILIQSMKIFGTIHNRIMLLNDFVTNSHKRRQKRMSVLRNLFG